MDWNKYKENFPDRYTQKSRIDDVIDDAYSKMRSSNFYRPLKILDIGGGKNGTFKNDKWYNIDKFYFLDPNITVAPDHYTLVSWDDIKDENFDLIVARGCLNYLTPKKLKEIKKNIKLNGMFIGNSFLLPTTINREYTINGIPAGIEKSTYDKVEVNVKESGYATTYYKPEWKGIIHHELIPFEGKKIEHDFYYYDIYQFISFFKPNNITLEVYGKNSVIIKCYG